MSVRLRRAPDGRPWVWGHRGARRELPENTLPAFERALAHGADGVELDVRPCRSGEVVVCHDRDLERVAGDARRVEALDWDALRRVDLGGGARVPRLDEALDLVLGAGKAVNVEIKRDVPGLLESVDAVARCIAARSRDEQSRIVISSFAWEAVERFAERAPGVAVGFLSENAEGAERVLPPAWGLHPRYPLVTPALVARLHAEGRYVATWTVNAAEEARRVADAGLDILITDDVPTILAAVAA